MEKFIETLEEVTIRFAGDSGDGMQLTGNQFSNTSALSGLDVNTFPDYPSEIRAPEGTLYGVSAFQVHVGSKKINTPGDTIDVLVAMNASSLKVSLPLLKKNGIIIANTSGFDNKNLELAKYSANPLENNSLQDYRVYSIDIWKLIQQELKDVKITLKEAERTKNIFCLGLVYWLFSQSLEPTIKWIKEKFSKNEQILKANLVALQAGWNYAAASESFTKRYEMGAASLEKGFYRNITGNNAVALALVAAAQKAKLPLFLGSYPITPATEILQYISEYKQYGVKHLQAEDEIAGICSAIGAAYGGNLAATTTSGPGLALKVEAMGLAVMTELPLVIIDVQRAGPSTGLPTKPEQADLLMAIFGRHGEAPMPVLAAASPTDCFQMTFEACRISLKYMTPVLLLTDGYIGQSSEPWKVPVVDQLPSIEPTFATDPESFAPYKRDPETLARLWPVPGVKGLEHRIGGLEKQDVTGTVSHDPKNHQFMVETRQKKVENIAKDIPLATVEGEEKGDLLIVGWGGTYGAIKTAFDDLTKQGKKVSYLHLRYLNPLPLNLGSVLSNFKKVLVPEMNLGQLKFLLQAKYKVEVEGFNKIQGVPFRADEIENKINELL